MEHSILFLVNMVYMRCSSCFRESTTNSARCCEETEHAQCSPGFSEQALLFRRNRTPKAVRARQRLLNRLEIFRSSLTSSVSLRCPRPAPAGPCGVAAAGSSTMGGVAEFDAAAALQATNKTMHPIRAEHLPRKPACGGLCPVTSAWFLQNQSIFRRPTEEQPGVKLGRPLVNDARTHGC